MKKEDGRLSVGCTELGIEDDFSLYEMFCKKEWLQ